MILDAWDGAYIAGLAVAMGVRVRHEMRRRAQRAEWRPGADGIERVLLALTLAGWLVVPLAWILTPWLAFATHPLPGAARAAGAVLMVPALALFWRAHSDLGDNWSPTLELRDGHQLVSRGLYAWVRHPMYLGMGALAAGLGLVASNALAGWMPLGTFVLLVVVRVPREERMMRARFGAAYDALVRQTGRLVPGPMRARGASPACPASEPEAFP